MLLLSVTLFNLFTILNAFQTSSDDNELLSRILYGTRADINEYPFFAGLSHCGAAIISDRWLITAAHCVLRNEDLVWVGGDSILRSQRYMYDKAVIHPQYKTIVFGIPVNDIALLRLSRPLTFSSTVKPVTLPKHDYERDAIHAFAGKGQNERSLVSNYLMTMNIRTVKQDECLSYLPWYLRSLLNQYLNQIRNVTICTRRVKEKQRLCFGDSGSPLVRNGTLVGIASYISDPNCFNAELGMFVNVAPFVDWIKFITGLE